ncbi:MAG: hypothetical protein NTY02_19110, partial [Acidobacteria bacterium]|nr:hypothetical protein [Acidobacteriota bacterium]
PQLDDIIGFAEIERFIDSPVKHYSSGMFLRLAFSVAIHLRPSILLADEILAVGDEVFQERCVQKVAEESSRGLTVLFVSHDMEAIGRLCHQTLWLDSGRVAGFGPTDDVVAAYREAARNKVLVKKTAEEAARAAEGDMANRALEVLSVQLIAPDGQLLSGALLSEPVAIRVRMRVFRAGVRLRCTLDLNAKGTLLLRAVQPEYVAERRSTYDVVVHIPKDLLAETKYSVDVFIETSTGKEDSVAKSAALTFFGHGAGEDAHYKAGLIAPHLQWTVHKVTPKRLRESPS